MDWFDLADITREVTGEVVTALTLAGIFSVWRWIIQPKWQEKAYRKNHSQDNTVRKKVNKNSKVESYLSVLFDDIEPSAHKMDIWTGDKSKEIWEVLENAAKKENEKRIDKGWEHVSLDIVEQKMWGSVLDEIHGLGDDYYASAVCGKNDDFSTDSYIIQKDTELPYYGITLIQSKWHSLTSTDTRFRHDNHEILSLLKAAAEYVHNKSDRTNNLTQSEKDWLEGPRKSFKHMFDNYHNDIADDPMTKLPQIYLVLVHHRKPDEDGGSFDYKRDTYKITCIDAIAAHSIIEGGRDFQIKADIHPKQIVIRNNELTVNLIDDSKSFKTYIGAISGIQLCYIYNSSKSIKGKKIRKRDYGVLQMNVRRRLAKPNVNDQNDQEIETRDFREIEKTSESIMSGMKDTLLSDENRYRFVAYNNGITMICSDFKNKGSGGKMAISNPQIVNGGQTTELLFSYFSAADDEYDDWLRELKVPIKIIDTKGQLGHAFLEIARDVALRVNHQNPTGPRQLYANDERFDLWKSYFEDLNVPIFLNVKEGAWNLMLEQSEQEVDNTILKYRKNRRKDGTARWLDVMDDFGMPRWAILGGGSLTNAQKRTFWNHRISIFHSEMDTPSYVGLAESSRLFDTDWEPFVLRGTNDQIRDEVLFAKIFFKELGAVKTRCGRRRDQEFGTITDEAIRNRYLRSTGAVKFPNFTLLALNEVLRIRCDEENLQGNADDWKEIRKEILRYFLGDGSDENDRRNTSPFIKDKSRITYKKWNSIKAISNTSLFPLRAFSCRSAMDFEKSLIALIEITTTNLAQALYDVEGNLPDAWRNKKSLCQQIMDSFLQKIEEDEVKRKLMSISLGDELKSKQEHTFNRYNSTLLTILEG